MGNPLLCFHRPSGELAFPDATPNHIPLAPPLPGVLESERLRPQVRMFPSESPVRMSPSGRSTKQGINLGFLYFWGPGEQRAEVKDATSLRTAGSWVASGSTVLRPILPSPLCPPPPPCTHPHLTPKTPCFLVRVPFPGTPAPPLQFQKWTWDFPLVTMQLLSRGLKPTARTESFVL